MSGKKGLDQFLAQWRREITLKSNDQQDSYSGKRKSELNTSAPHEQNTLSGELHSKQEKRCRVEGVDCDHSRNQSSTLQSKFDLKSSQCEHCENDALHKFVASKAGAATSLKCEHSYFNDYAVDGLLADKCSRNDNSAQEHINEKKTSEERLVDILLADLDEINEIPFFDLTVPREVAMNIFQHFDMVDLCRCAQVSRSWRNIAEDELLWCRLCHRLGYELESLTSDKTGWKDRAEHLYTKDKTLVHNWNNRIGRYEELAYVPGGILCAADSARSLVAGGYTSGQVCVWDMDTGLDAVYRPSSISLMINEAVDRGTLANELTSVQLGHRIAAASYSQGVVDVWHLDGGVDPVHTSRANASQSYICCHRERSVLAYSFDRTVSMVEVRTEHGHGGVSKPAARTLNTNHFGQNVVWLKFVPKSDELLCVQTGHVIRLQTSTMAREALPVVHELVDSMVACADVDEEYLDVGVTSYGLLDGCKIQVYKVLTGQLMTSLSGIGGMGLKCINVSDSPENMVISGGQDRRVYVHDYREPAPVLTLHPDLSISRVQMDEVKAVVNGHDGQTCVYDLRTRNKLWQFHNRHPVVYSRFGKHKLITANVPQCKYFEEEEQTDHMTHKRFRGGIHVYDFSVTNETEGIPTICKSSYDSRAGYSYNINLTMPYDRV